MRRLGLAGWCTWVACLFAVSGAVASIVLPSGGANRSSGAAVPLVLAAGALVANGLEWRRPGWLSGSLYGLTAAAFFYSILLTLLLPLRVLVEGPCPPQLSQCPLGFEHPLTSGESAAVYVVTSAAAIALMLTLVAFEARHMSRRRIRPEQSDGSPR